MSTQPRARKAPEIQVRAMQIADVPAARTIFQLAFGTFIGAPDPQTFWADRDYVGTRCAGDLGGALVAESDGAVVGSNFSANWGSFGFFGPLTIHPEWWDRGIAQRLLEPTMQHFQDWGVRHAGLFTFAQSAKHVGLYQKYGFWPRFLTAVMAKAPGAKAGAGIAYSSLGESQHEQILQACREVTGSIFEGLDLGREIRAIHRLKLGETLLLWAGNVLEGFACCHCGAGTEAGAGTCYVKFAAVRPSSGAEQSFGRLLDACDALAAARGLNRVEAGVSLGRERAYRKMRERGYRTEFQGVAMHKPNQPGFTSPAAYVIDDWR
jgi:GNAT superfamily N-acetyltransferase